MNTQLIQQALAEVRQAQEDTDVMSIWYALQELVDYYEEELKTTLCDVIGCENTMDKFACRDCLQEDEPICVECCPLVEKNIKLWKMEVK